MRVSSGDQNGRSQSVVEFVICPDIGEPRSRTNTCRTPFTVPVNAIRFPSGDQDGDPAYELDTATGCRCIAAKSTAAGGIRKNAPARNPAANPAIPDNAPRKFHRRGGGFTGIAA